MRAEEGRGRAERDTHVALVAPVGLSLHWVGGGGGGGDGRRRHFRWMESGRSGMGFGGLVKEMEEKLGICLRKERKSWDVEGTRESATI